MPDSFAFDAKSTYDMAMPQNFSKNQSINTLLSSFGAKLAVQAMTAQIWSGNTETDLSIELEFHTETDPATDVRAPILNLLKLTMPSINTSFGLLQSPGPSLNLSQLLGNANGQVTPTSIASSIGSGASSLVQSGGAVLNALFTGATPTQGQLNDSSLTSNDGTNSAVPATSQSNPSLGTAAYWKSRTKNSISIRIGNYMFFDSVVITSVQQTFSSNFDAQTGLPHHAKVMVGFKPLFMLLQDDLEQLFVNPTGGSTTGSNNFGFSMPNATPSAPSAFGFHL